MGRRQDDGIAGDAPQAIVCNAEPFGGGPGATLAAVVPYLERRLRGRPGPVALHFAGSGHALAFQRLRRGGAWDGLHDVDVHADPDAGRAQLAALCARLRPLLLLTVSDSAMAAAARAVGCPVVVVDLLLWFWPRVPAPWREAERVVATDFYGIRERIADERLANVVTVPPLGPPAAADDDDDDGGGGGTRRRRRLVVVNLGGLLHPLMPASDMFDYAGLVYAAARRALALRNAAAAAGDDAADDDAADDDAADDDAADDDAADDDAAELVVAAGSAELARALDPDESGAVRAVWPDEALALMAAADLVCCTPGLGNLHAAAAVARDVLLLPPVSSSQGLQRWRLESAGIRADSVDWHHLTGGEPVDYAAGHSHVAAAVRAAQADVAASAPARERLAGRMLAAMARSSTTRERPLRPLMDAFGQDAGDAIAAHVVDVVDALLARRLGETRAGLPPDR